MFSMIPHGLWGKAAWYSILLVIRILHEYESLLYLLEGVCILIYYFSVVMLFPNRSKQ